MPMKVDKDAEAKALQALGEDAVDRVTDEFSYNLLLGLPVEDGHGHEAFATAMEKLPLPRVSRVPDEFRGDRSGDPEAIKRGESGWASDKDHVWVSIAARLPFLRHLEEGGTIRVGDLSGNKGPKEGGPDTGGQLYAPRLPGTTGLLFWEDSGGRHMAKTRNIPSGYKFMAKAVKKARQLAKRLGLKRKR